MSLIGNKDVDMEILLKLNDSKIPRVCAVNRYVNQICESDIFWYRKLIDRIEKVKKDNFSRVKDLLDREVNGEGIREMMKFFGFETPKQLYQYLNRFQEKSLYLIYFQPDAGDLQVNDNYEIDKNKLPIYINYDQLIYYLRREIIIGNYSMKIFHFPDPLNNTVGYKLLNKKYNSLINYQALIFEKLGIMLK